MENEMIKTTPVLPFLAARDPLVPNDSAEHKQKNRRTEFDIEELGGKRPDGYTAACAPNSARH
jgi:hypothetical protein